MSTLKLRFRRPGNAQMTDDEAVKPKPISSKTDEATRKIVCEECGGMAVIKRTMLSIYTGKTVRVFECSAAHRTWTEE